MVHENKLCLIYNIVIWTGVRVEKYLTYLPIIAMCVVGLPI